MMPSRIENLLPRDHRPMAREEVEGSIPDRFDSIVARHPAGIAIDDGRERHSYSEFDRRIDRIAASILARSGPAPEPVALLCSDPYAFYCSLFAVLRAGKFYAALDATLAPEKLASLARHLESGLILCDRAHHGLALLLARELGGCRVVNVDREVAGRFAARTRCPAGPDDIACIVYTSGSTRSPEGVAITHRAALHFVMNHTNNLHIRAEDRGSQLCPFTSAACCGEVFPILLNGGTLLPYSIREQGIGALPAWLRDGRVTIYTSVPAVFRLLTSVLDEQATFPDVRVIKLSGDRILSSDVEAFRKHFSRTCLFRAALGASEALLYTQFFADHAYAGDGAVVPAGYALEDMEVFIVDDDLNRLGPGETGEIAVKSRYLSAGYWRNPSLTAERFLPVQGEDGARIYLSRDLGFMREDGCLMHLGRKDSRAKIHGKWVRLDELEEAILRFPGVADAAVVVCSEETGETRLTAFHVGTDGRGADSLAIRRHLLSLFPPEAVPAAFIEIETMPLSASNKTDRLALAALGRGEGRKKSRRATG